MEEYTVSLMAFFVQFVERAYRLVIGGDLDCELLIEELYGADDCKKRVVLAAAGAFIFRYFA